MSLQVNEKKRMAPTLAVGTTVDTALDRLKLVASLFVADGMEIAPNRRLARATGRNTGRKNDASVCLRCRPSSIGSALAGCLGVGLDRPHNAWVNNDFAALIQRTGLDQRKRRRNTAGGELASTTTSET